MRVRAHDLVDGYGGQEVVVDLSADSGPNFEVERQPYLNLKLSPLEQLSSEQAETGLDSCNQTRLSIVILSERIARTVSHLARRPSR